MSTKSSAEGDTMWTKWGWNIQVEDLRNHDLGTVMTLRYLLKCGAKITPDPKRTGFYEVEGESTVFYVYAPTRNGKVTLLATWPSESALAVCNREALRPSGADEGSYGMNYPC